MRSTDAERRAREEPDAAARAPACSTRLPHRALALHALRQLARGNYLVVGGETSLAIGLNGVPYIAHLLEDFMARGLVRRVDTPELKAECYTLSAFGRETLRRGEEWWQSLGILERLRVQLTG